MTLEYRCSKCGALLETTAADPRIEAAPKMLAALKAAYVELQKHIGGDVTLQIYEAIAEAEGKS